MNTLTYKGYTTKVEFDPEDNILFGNILGIRDTVGFHGETVDELKEAFYESVDFYLESCNKVGREPNTPFFGTFMIKTNLIDCHIINFTRRSEEAVGILR